MAAGEEQQKLIEAIVEHGIKHHKFYKTIARHFNDELIYGKPVKIKKILKKIEKELENWKKG